MNFYYNFSCHFPYLQIFVTQIPAFKSNIEKHIKKTRIKYPPTEVQHIDSTIQDPVSSIQYHKFLIISSANSLVLSKCRIFHQDYKNLSLPFYFL